MSPAEPAVLLELKPAGMGLSVLLRRVVSLLAILASQCYHFYLSFSHVPTSHPGKTTANESNTVKLAVSIQHYTPQKMELATRIELVTSSLPRMRSAD
jgi:hypothetical protein